MARVSDELARALFFRSVWQTARDMPKRAAEDDAVVELLTWDPSDGTDEDEGDEAFDDELPADEAFEGAKLDDDDPEWAEAEAIADALEEVDADGFTAGKKPELPQPDRARSHPDLPRVKSSAFKRVIR